MTENQSAEPSAQYRELVKALENVVWDCVSVSQACAGISSPSGAHYYASILFTSLCSRAVSLLMLVPYSPTAEKAIEHWDYSSTACIVRSILEVRLAFFYLCVENCTKDEWDCRWNVFNLHDCSNRLRVFENLPGGSVDVSGFKIQIEDIKNALAVNSFFQSLPQSLRKQLNNGNKAYLSPTEDIAVRAGINLRTFRYLYRFLSSQIHGLPMSYYRMGIQERGRGVHSDVEEHYTRLCISFTMTLMLRARDEMKVLFPPGS
jgi:hypothetical protein